MIKGFVRGQALCLETDLIVESSVDYEEAEFSFSDDWTGLTAWAHFAQGDTVYDIELTGNKIKKEDHLNLGAGKWSVYLHGNEYDGEDLVERVTTERARFEVKKTGALDGEPLPEIPASAAEQIEAKATNAVNIANEAKEVAETSQTSCKAYAEQTETLAEEVEENASAVAQAKTEAVEASEKAQEAEQTVEDAKLFCGLKANQMTEAEYASAVISSDEWYFVSDSPTTLFIGDIAEAMTESEYEQAEKSADHYYFVTED